MTPPEGDVVRRVLQRLVAAPPRVVVIGDVLLDRWWAGSADRISREAPAPVVQVTDRIDVPGGAANTAMNLAALGARVVLVGAVGADEPGERLVALLDAAGVDTAGVVRASGLATTTKTRVVGGGQVLVRLDEGGVPDDDARQSVLDAALAAATGADAELVCDYGLGALDGLVRDGLAARAARPALTAVDAHELAPWAALRPTVVTPNAGEVERLLGVPLAGDRAADAAALRDALLAATGATSVVVTLDRDGTVFHAPEGTGRTLARPAPDSQANGAGDTFAAALTLALACGEPMAGAAAFAQAAADVVVRQPGTSVCTPDALAASLTSGARTLPADALVAALEAERRAGRRIVFTNGCFDVLHLGHTTYLKQAKRLGDVLVVALNDDESVRRLKGPGRPINSAADRAGVIAELACVDYVTVFGSDTPIPLLERIRPDVYAKGGDYTPAMLEETPVVQAAGGEVRIVDYVSPHSTTSVIARARALSDVGSAADD
ncbi:D-glycero-beta-D-manno-heptose 1-phosphate adenylyltransferase [Amnibacterium sp. CER49]|uniref:D-glycero-beta-D-manno-heptose 1-phosphate adenylyltransferase n=1 Tax=Amnibacterium sp. CER49 TaxID=3039161 RepID=UPI00244C918B|nr:D-glycero-beta-D-manno-heptose 1-phosphate adenylyltransferase [Amnibacterium sp. CER49]MDH2445399.1 D-glycero-beta-D-manno-heptose 1-phosphate adenylyltransferase [Amnibacterium sp. CER49]